MWIFEFLKMFIFLVYGDNGKFWELLFEESFEVWKNVFIRLIGVRVVVDDELIIGGVLRWIFVRWFFR